MNFRILLSALTIVTGTALGQQQNSNVMKVGAVTFVKIMNLKQKNSIQISSGKHLKRFISLLKASLTTVSLVCQAVLISPMLRTCSLRQV